MCEIRLTNWRRPVSREHFSTLLDRYADETDTVGLIWELAEAFPESRMRPNVFVIALVVESFRARTWSFKDPIVPGMVRFPFGVYVTNGRGEVVARYQTQFMKLVHDELPTLLMSAQTVERLNGVLGRFGYVMRTDHCCGEVFLPQEQEAAFLKSKTLAQREFMRLQANEREISFRVVPRTAFIPFERSDFGEAERGLHDAVHASMEALCGSMAHANEFWRANVRAIAS